MDGQAHFRKAEELAAKAAEYLGQGGGQDSAAVWAAVAQVHATLALAAATAAKDASAAHDVRSPSQSRPVSAKELTDREHAAAARAERRNQPLQTGQPHHAGEVLNRQLEALSEREEQLRRQL